MFRPNKTGGKEVGICKCAPGQPRRTFGTSRTAIRMRYRLQPVSSRPNRRTPQTHGRHLGVSTMHPRHWCRLVDCAVREKSLPNTDCITSVDIWCNDVTYWLSTDKLETISPASRCNSNAAPRTSWRSITCSHSEGNDPTTRQTRVPRRTPETADDGIGLQMSDQHVQHPPHGMLSPGMDTRAVQQKLTGACLCLLVCRK